MKAPQPPRLEERRAAQFAEELRARARGWIPSWALDDGVRDFGSALLDVAARFSSEVAERLDRVPEKMRRGFLDWLAVRGKAARAARMPVVFKLAGAARNPIDAPPLVRMQVSAGDANVVFETETGVRLIPGRLQVVAGVDGAKDAFYLPPPGLSDLQPLEPLPVQWQLKSYAAAGTTTLQLDPEAGLAPEMIIEAGGQQYRVVKADKEIATIDPPLAAELRTPAVVRKVTAFAPFDGISRNRQEHALYLGHTELLDVESVATLAIAGAQRLRTGVTWQYWGKVDPDDAVDWQTLTPLPELEQTQPDAVLLTKPKGAIVPREIDGNSSRWIRAVVKTIPFDQDPFHPAQLAIRVNPADCQQEEMQCPPETAESPAAEGMANTTPLVLGNIFFPLGRQPKQFDAFYLGSTEAFSKKGADVLLCFTMADPTFVCLSRGVGVLGTNVLAGVPADRALHLLQFNDGNRTLNKYRNLDPLRPPSAANAVGLDSAPAWRLPVWTDATHVDLFIGTTAGADVWIWHELADQAQSRWEAHGQIPAQTPGSTAKADGLVYLAGTPPMLAALRDGLLSLSDLSAATPHWDSYHLTANLKTIVPVLDGALLPSVTEGLVGSDANNQMFSVATTGTIGTCTPIASSLSFDLNVRPAAVRLGTDIAVVGVDTSATPNLVAFHPTLPTASPAALGTGAKVHHSIDVVMHAGQLHFLASVTDANEGYLATWAPFDPSAPATPFQIPVPAGVGEIGGAPTALDHDVVVPGAHADVFIADFDLSRRFGGNVTLHPGIVLPASAPSLVHHDLVARIAGGVLIEAHEVTGSGVPRDGETAYPIDNFFANGTPADPLYAFPVASASLTGNITGPHTFKLQAGDQIAAPGDFLNIDGHFCKIKVVAPNSPQWVVKVFQAIPSGGAGTYARGIPTGGRTGPAMSLNPFTDGNWDATILQRTQLLFPGATPELQTGKAFLVYSNNHPGVVVLGEDFTSLPNTFILDASAGEWGRFLGDTSSNPELSWEYWNGKGWWDLEVTVDETLNLKSKGRLQFTVPDDIASSDWAGKTNYWIRARLVGGDYGLEKITTVSTTLNNTTTQTINRSTDGISAPAVVKLQIAYRLCDGVLPLFVLAQDSGTMRDQSEANRTRGAVVEAFVPLAAAVGRLSGTLDTGRAMYIGLDAAPNGAPVNLLLLVDKEAPYEEFAPMKIDALVADRFVPIVADDTTRALGESGLLSLSFAIPPTPRELFGLENLTWLRLSPASGGSESDWQPAIRGAYLNAVWATAAETLTRELLGSSDGSPNLTVHLARPPVLHDSLELRVLEPLGDEERDQLREDDENQVVSDDALPGDWVLWRQVADPDDETAMARVYALDEATGEVRFGDGQHGMIPPIGRDSIVAFRYRRTEIGGSDTNDVPGNSIVARTALGLVSPVESVEAVFAADQAAGGAPPEPDDRVVRFGAARLRHRERAVSALDVEDLALESSPGIVQARCFVRPGEVRLVVVMRGKNPLPNAAQVREVARLLLDSAPASLSAPGALRISGPRIRRIRVGLDLRIASLDHAGEVSKEVLRRISALFDTATGGADQDGWALGATPDENDVALALLGTPYLESIGNVTLTEVMSDKTERTWAGTVKRDELVMLDDDGVRLELETVEVIA